MPFYKKPIKSALPFFFNVLLLSFSGCSNLEPATTSQVSFTISAARAVITDSVEPSEIYIDVELKGGHEDSKSAALSANQETTFTFDNVPVGKQVYIAAKLYTKYGSEDILLYHGQTEAQEILAEGNTFQLSFEKDYNKIVQTDSSYFVSRPLFSLENDMSRLTTNKLEFKNNGHIPDESFIWELADLKDYQKVRMTFKGDKAAASEGADSAKTHAFLFQFGSTTCGALYVNEKLSVTGEKSVCEFEIPQAVNVGTIRLENDYIIGDTVEQNKWADDFNLYIEKIELIKDASLIDPDFNQVTKTDYTYTVKNPAIVAGTAVQIEKNHLKFDALSRIKRYQSQFSAAYWLCDTLSDYDKVTLTIKCNNPQESDLRFELKGYKPVHYPDLTEDKRSGNTEDIVNLSNPDATGPETITFTTDITNLTTGLEAGELQALEFVNLSFAGDDYDDFTAWKDPDIEILEIKLEKKGTYTINISVPGSQDIEVSTEDIKDSNDIVIGKRFTAPEGYTSYIWKVNGQIQTSFTENVFDFDMSDLITGKIYDITLLATNETFNHSWSAQVTKE